MLNTQDFHEMIDLFYGNWVWRAIHALIEHPHFSSSPQWIADTLNITVEEVVDALEGLNDLGLIEKDGAKIRLKVPQLLIPDDKQTRSYMVEKHKQVSAQIISATTGESAAGTFSFFLNAQASEILQAVKNLSEEILRLDSSRSPLPQGQSLFAVTLTCNELSPHLTQRKENL